MLRSELVSNRLQEEMAPLKAAEIEHAVDVVLDEIRRCSGRKAGASSCAALVRSPCASATPAPAAIRAPAQR